MFRFSFTIFLKMKFYQCCIISVLNEKMQNKRKKLMMMVEKQEQNKKTERHEFISSLNWKLEIIIFTDFFFIFILYFCYSVFVLNKIMFFLSKKNRKSIWYWIVMIYWWRKLYTTFYYLEIEKFTTREYYRGYWFFCVCVDFCYIK